MSHFLIKWSLVQGQSSIMSAPVMEPGIAPTSTTSTSFSQFLESVTPYFPVITSGLLLIAIYVGRSRIVQLEDEVDALKKKTETLEGYIQALHDRLAALEGSDSRGPASQRPSAKQRQPIAVPLPPESFEDDVWEPMVRVTVPVAKPPPRASPPPPPAASAPSGPKVEDVTDDTESLIEKEMQQIQDERTQ